MALLSWRPSKHCICSSPHVHDLFAVKSCQSVILMERRGSSHKSSQQKGYDRITRTTSLEDIINVLAKRGCSNLTQVIDSTTCSTLPLAGGGFCDVYRGALYDGTRIAIKSLRVFDSPGKSDAREKVLKRAARELYYWSKLKHQNVLPLIGLAIFRDQISIVSEWMENSCLMTYVRLNPDANRIKLCVEACAGLCYIHAKGMAHGDIKAANVMVSPNGTAMVSDFGNSELKDITLKFTKTSNASFTVRWAAPEILLKDSGPYASKEADVYAYGMTVLEVLTGKVPYEGLSERQVVGLVAYKHQHPVRPEAAVTDDLWDILTSCWISEPTERPQMTVVRDRLNAPMSMRIIGSPAKKSPTLPQPEIGHPLVLSLSGNSGPGQAVCDREATEEEANDHADGRLDLSTKSIHGDDPHDNEADSSEIGSPDFTWDDVSATRSDYTASPSLPASAHNRNTVASYTGSRQASESNYSPEPLFRSRQVPPALPGPSDEVPPREPALDPGNPHITQRLNLLRNVQANGGTLPAAPSKAGRRRDPAQPAPPQNPPTTREKKERKPPTKRGGRESSVVQDREISAPAPRAPGSAPVSQAAIFKVELGQNSLPPPPVPGPNHSRTQSGSNGSGRSRGTPRPYMFPRRDVDEDYDEGVGVAESLIGLSSYQGPVGPKPSMARPRTSSSSNMGPPRREVDEDYDEGVATGVAESLIGLSSYQGPAGPKPSMARPRT